MRFTLVPWDSIPGFSAKPVHQFEIAPGYDGSAWILTKVTNQYPGYGILGIGTSAVYAKEMLTGRPIASATEPYHQPTLTVRLAT